MNVWSIVDKMFESTVGEGDRVSLGETTLEEGTGGVWGRQTLMARGKGPTAPGHQGLPPQTPPPLSSRVPSPN